MDKLFPGTWTIYAGIVLVVLLLGVGVGWEVNGWRLHADLAKVTGERNQLKQGIKDAKTLADTQHKNDVAAATTSENTNAKQLTDTARGYSDYIEWLRQHPAGGRATCTASVPAVPADAAGHGAQPARTVGISEEEILALLRQGDACRDDLNAAKVWAQGRANATRP